MVVVVKVVVVLAPVTSKLAVTDWSESMMAVHVDVPEHPAPLQPVNVDPGSGIAVSVTEVSVAKLAVQTQPQSMPVGLLVTAPAPVPVLATVSRCATVETPEDTWAST